MSAPSIELSGISRRHRTGGAARSLLKDVSLSIAASERVILIGANGSGKSTILRIILGLEKQDAGEVRATPDLSRVCVSYVPQDYRNALFPWLRLSANLALWLGDEVADWSEAFDEFAAALKIVFDRQKYPYELSGGEQQLLLFAQALLRRPSLLIMDEPFSAVDSARKQLALEILTDYLHRDRCTLVGVTHDISDAVFIADRVIILAPDSDQIRHAMSVPLQWPRKSAKRVSREFAEIVEQVTRAVL
jgi:NitT/TauT family transport system ATP-binding protein